VQEDAVVWLMGQSARFKGVNIPTGGGKTLCGVGYAVLTGKRAAYLMGTRNLQTQYTNDLRGSSLRWADLRGQANYKCLRDGGATTCDEGSCHAGVPCEMKADGCLYFDSVRAAGDADHVVLNYAAWHNVQNGGGKDVAGWLRAGAFDCLVLDEGDSALDHLGAYLTIEVGAGAVARLGAQLPDVDSGLAEVQSWARGLSGKASELVKGAVGARARIEAQRLARDLTRLGEVVGDWVPSWERAPWGRTLKVEPLMPSAYREVLLRDIPDIVVLSATLSARFMEMLTETRPPDA
jgi:Rad3-related DNA helicase